jgi:hypothetical protein
MVRATTARISAIANENSGVVLGFGFGTASMGDESSRSPLVPRCAMSQARGRLRLCTMHSDRPGGTAGTGYGKVRDVGILILLALAAMLFRWQGDAWTVVAGKLVVVLILYLLAIYVVFGVGIGGLS